MNNKIFKYLAISDIHLGHPKNKTENIINSLNLFLLDYKKELKNINCVFFNGDLFDKLLAVTSNEYKMAARWFSKFVLFCSTNKIKIRVLEGTPSHDWKQFSLLMDVISKLNIDIDLKYIETIHIEYMEEFDLNILYVPDEYSHDANETYEDVLKLLKENNLTKVDIAMMHGAFKYQLPIELKFLHTEEYYLNIVKYFISIGHIHTASIYSRIIANGSFERLKHGEEEDKGAMLFTISKDIQEYKFLKNKHSLIFNGYKYKDVYDVDFIISDLHKKINSLPQGSHIKVFVEDDVYLNKSFKIINERYKNYKITSEGFKYDKTLVVKDKLVYDGTETESFQITIENIEELMSKELSKHNLDKLQFNIFKNELINVLNSI